MLAVDAVVVIAQVLECFVLAVAAHVAVPDFSAGAMENWGLVVYRETALLYDEMTSSAANKQRVAIVLSHELAHMVKSKDKNPQASCKLECCCNILAHYG